MTDDTHSHINELMRINNSPRRYDPRAGDELEWSGITLRVKRVSADDEVLFEEVDLGSDTPTNSAVPHNEPEDATPYGIWTWATMDSNPTLDDVRRMLEDGWHLQTRTWD